LQEALRDLAASGFQVAELRRTDQELERLQMSFLCGHLAAAFDAVFPLPLRGP
jgi:hypothetical protein